MPQYTYLDTALSQKNYEGTKIYQILAKHIVEHVKIDRAASKILSTRKTEHSDIDSIIKNSRPLPKRTWTRLLL